MKKYLLALLGLCVLVVSAACGGGSSVTTPPPPPALTITSGAPPSGTVGVPYGDGGFGFAVTSSGGVQPYNWTWAAASGSTLPPGLAFSNLGISGEPTAQGAYKVVITVTDSQTPPAHTSNPYTINVAPMAPLAITANPPDGVAGEVYSESECNPPPNACGSWGYELGAHGGVQPYGWTWAGASGSTTPPGLDIVSHGRCPDNNLHTSFNDWRIVCIPTTSGTYNVVITVKDSASPPNQVSANYTIKILGPVINTVPPPAQGAIDLPYNFEFTASNVNYVPLLWSETGALPPGLNLASDGTLSGTPTSTGSFPITLKARDSQGNDDTRDFTIVIGKHGFKATGSMTTGREFHTATLVSAGSALITGGEGNDGILASAELFDPATGTFSLTHDMSTAREWFSATLLKDGKVLIAGGYDGNTALATAEVFDPTSGTFAPTENMTTGRFRHTATLLSTGKVLIAGGQVGFGSITASAELYDPATDTFSATDSMTAARQEHTATALQDGRVLVTGGQNNFGIFPGDVEASAEVYDPGTDSFSSVGKMSTPRVKHTATLLTTGKILVAGGHMSEGCTTEECADADDLNSAELFDPASGTFSLTGSMAIPRRLHTATLLKDGTVLVAGGGNGNVEPPDPLASAEIFNPNTGSFSNTGSLLTARAGQTATLLENGTVLVIGGEESVFPPFLASAEIYQ